ncbi:Aldolase [Methylocella tundrae]|nr:Aldolase [Methylocella tundrae]
MLKLTRVKERKSAFAGIGWDFMTTFDKREQAFEAQLVHDEALKFKAIARRNKWFGLWAAGMLGKTGAEAEAYANAVVQTDIAQGAEEFFRKVRADFDKAGVQLSDHQIRRKLEELLVAAIAEVKGA